MYSIPFVGLLVISCLFCMANGAPAPYNEMTLGVPSIPVKSSYTGRQPSSNSYSGPTIQIPDPALYNTNSRQYPNSQQSAHYNAYNHPLTRASGKLEDAAHLGQWAGNQIVSRVGEGFDKATDLFSF